MFESSVTHHTAHSLHWGQTTSMFASSNVKIQDDGVIHLVEPHCVRQIIDHIRFQCKDLQYVSNALFKPVAFLVE